MYTLFADYTVLKHIAVEYNDDVTIMTIMKCKSAYKGTEYYIPHTHVAHQARIRSISHSYYNIVNTPRGTFISKYCL